MWAESIRVKALQPDEYNPGPEDYKILEFLLCRDVEFRNVRKHLGDRLYRLQACH